MNKLLIQACSGRKMPSIARIPALDLYDGVAFRVIKKFLRENPHRQSELLILIVSAKYGLISAEEKISAYDLRMNSELAQRQQKRNRRGWTEFSAGRKFDRILVNVGRDYMPALDLLKLPPQTQFAAGGIGERNGKLKEWLLAV